MKIRLCLTQLFMIGIVSAIPMVLSAQESERPTAPKLFPSDTLAYLRVDDVSELKASFAKTSIGKLGNDEQLKPILSEFYGGLVQNAKEIQESLGLNLDELLSIPTGEMAIALLPSIGSSANVNVERGDSNATVSASLNSPAVALLLDAGDEISSVELLLERIEERAPNLVRTEKTIDRLTLYRYSNPNRQREQAAYFIDQGVMVACSDAGYLEQLAEVWLGNAGDRETLADNGTFTTIMSRCVGTEGERPQVAFYVDPLAIVRKLAPKTTAVQMGLAVLPALGIDGIKGVGGSLIFAPADFDSINHFHVELSSPRRSILGLIRPKSGPTSPEAWVPDSVASYSTINWDLISTLKGIEQLFNQFRGPDALEEQVFAEVNQRLELDIRKDILENLDGRITLLQGIVRPLTVNSGSNVYAIKFKNADFMKSKVLPRVKELIGQRIEIQQANFGKLQVDYIEPGRRNGRDTNAPIRTPEICFTMYEDYLIIADSKYMMQQVAGALNGTSAPLRDALEFQLISDRISSQLQEKDCSAISYARPEESLQVFYELARDPANVERLRGFAEGNGFFKALLTALEKHKLPPFAVISKYLAPSGGFLVDDETGIHYTTFGLRRE